MVDIDFESFKAFQRSVIDKLIMHDGITHGCKIAQGLCYPLPLRTSQFFTNFLNQLC